MNSLLHLFQPRSLQHKYALYILLPTLLILVLMGLISLLIVRRVLLDQWEEATIAKMQRSAFQVDQQLARPKRILMLYQEQTDDVLNVQVSRFLIDRLREMKGITEVTMEWSEGENRRNSARMGGDRRMGSMHYSRMRTLEVSAPEYDDELKGETVSLVSEFQNDQGVRVGRIVVQISFDSLIAEIVKSPWWQSNAAFLLDSDGTVLARTKPDTRMEGGKSEYIFGVGSELEKITLQEMNEHDFGTVLGKGIPPREVSGYYRLQQAPWTIVLIAPGKVALEPILKFREYYFMTSIVGILLALLFIRLTTNRTALAIRKVSHAAQELASGRFFEPLVENGHDEVAELTRTFNIMTRQLKERMEMQQAMEVAREIQQNLLPQTSYQAAGLDISGTSIYCQETGGDYFDILPDRQDPCRVRVVLGDVVGHGIGAALLMASIRSLVRCRTSLAGTSEAIIHDVNRLLCLDTEASGNFVSLFFLEIEHRSNVVHWVRCGHDPALVYDLLQDKFFELYGEGLVLGLDREWSFVANSRVLPGESVIVMTSDGVWEAENESGEQFGRDRLKEVIVANRLCSSEEIITAITEAVTLFRGGKKQIDDLTLVVVKTQPYSTNQ